MDLNTLAWRKSSHSDSNGGDCVELAPLWRKSSHSDSNGGNCVELADWRKSTHSADNGGNCVEVAAARPSVALRDSKHPDRGALFLTAPAFAELVSGLRG